MADRHQTKWQSPYYRKQGPNGRNLCINCGNECPRKRQNWCSHTCFCERNWSFQLVEVWKRDLGVCSICGLNTYALKQEFRAWKVERRYVGGYYAAESREWCKSHGIPIFRTGLSWYDVDHIIPVSEGGTNKLENLRTLCIPCHKKETDALKAKIKWVRREAGTLLEIQNQ